MLPAIFGHWGWAVSSAPRRRVRPRATSPTIDDQRACSDGDLPEDALLPRCRRRVRAEDVLSPVDPRPRPA